MVSLWWSFALTVIGVVGLALVYGRPRSLIGPGIGFAVQALWVAYAVDTGQYWFLLSAFAYGSVNAYGLIKRREAARRYPCGCLADGPAVCRTEQGQPTDSAAIACDFD